MFGSLKNKLRGIVANAGTALSERVNLPFGLGEKFREAQIASDAAAASRELARENNITGIRAHALIEKLFAASHRADGSPIRVRSRTDQEYEAMDPFAAKPAHDDPARLISCMNRLRFREGTCLMLTIAEGEGAGEVIKIEKQGERNISVRTRALGGRPEKPSLIKEEQFGLLYAAVKQYLEQGDSSMIRSLAAGVVPAAAVAAQTSTAEEALPRSALHEDTQRLYKDNSPQWQAEKRQARLKERLGFA